MKIATFPRRVSNLAPSLLALSFVSNCDLAAAHAAGVDEVSAVLLIDSARSFKGYYRESVIGGDGQRVPDVATLDVFNLSQQVVNESLDSSFSSVPEPSSLVLLGGSSICVFKRRRWQ